MNCFQDINSPHNNRNPSNTPLPSLWSSTAQTISEEWSGKRGLGLARVLILEISTPSSPCVRIELPSLFRVTSGLWGRGETWAPWGHNSLLKNLVRSMRNREGLHLLSQGALPD